MSRGRARLTTGLLEALVSVSARPGRMVLTMLGEALGLAALVATVGLAATAEAQVAEHFDRATADQVTVTPAEDRRARGAVLPEDAESAVRRLSGVRSAGSLTRLPVSDPTRTVRLTDPQGLPDPVLPVLAVSPGVLEATSAEVRGRELDTGHDQRADAVALLGAEAAERLGVGDLADAPAVFVGRHALTVIGIVESVERRGELLDGVVVPEGTAARLFGWRGAGELVVDVAPRTADSVAGQAPLAISPADPAAIEATAPPSDTLLRESVQGDVSSLLLVLGVVALVAGGIGIANIMLLSVMERVGEIGLRRALGATRRDLMVQFLAESGTLGLLGGVVGTSLGLGAALVVATARDWTPILEPAVLAAPLVGLVVGLLAGALPAWRAGTLEPAAALRSL